MLHALYIGLTTLPAPLLYATLAPFALLVVLHLLGKQG